MGEKVLGVAGRFRSRGNSDWHSFLLACFPARSLSVLQAASTPEFKLASGLWEFLTLSLTLWRHSKPGI